MDTLQKIVKVTQQQYDILKNDGTVGDYTGLNSNYIYLVQEDYNDITYANLNSTASLGTIGLNKVYPIGLDDDNKLAVYVPWTDNNTTYLRATNKYLGLIKPWYSTTGASIYNGSSTAPSAGSDTPNINLRSTTTGRYYAVEMDANGRAYVNVPWPDSTVVYDYGHYAYGEKGSWRIYQQSAPGNNLDIRYGVITITSQSANYDVSFAKSFTSTNYTVVFGLYRLNKQNWFWSPIVQDKFDSGFKVFVRGNASGDNGGTLMYLAIRSN